MMNTRILLAGTLLLVVGIVIGGCGNDSSSGNDSGNLMLGSEEDPGSDTEEPGYPCSISVPDPEPTDLSSLASISADSAGASALAANPGASIVEVELDNENGCLVYGVELNNGLDVKVDAGNGTVVYTETPDSGEDSEGEDEDESGGGG